VRIIWLPGTTIALTRLRLLRITVVAVVTFRVGARPIRLYAYPFLTGLGVPVARL
jgi:hypothetical protein